MVETDIQGGLLEFLESFCLIQKIMLSEMGLVLTFRIIKTTVYIFVFTLLVFPININN